MRYGSKKSSNFFKHFEAPASWKAKVMKFYYWSDSTKSKNRVVRNGKEAWDESIHLPDDKALWHRKLQYWMQRVTCETGNNFMNTL
jgi:hypothetical protein